MHVVPLIVVAVKVPLLMGATSANSKNEEKRLGCLVEELLMLMGFVHMFKRYRHTKKKKPYNNRQ